MHIKLKGSLSNRQNDDVQQKKDILKPHANGSLFENVLLQIVQKKNKNLLAGLGL